MGMSVWKALLWGCWGVFAVVWIAGAIHSARRSPTVRARSGRRFSWLAFAAVWLFLSLVPRSDWKALSVDLVGLRILGGVILVGSTAFALWARVALGAMWSSAPLARDGHQLRTEGPYAITRHPIYTGILGMVIGSSLVADVGPFVVVLAVVALGLAVKIRQEERLMTETFRDEYDEYRRRVPRIIPGLHLIRGVGGH